MLHFFQPFLPLIVALSPPYLSLLFSSFPFGLFPLYPLHGFNSFCSINYFSFFFLTPQSVISSRLSFSAALLNKFDTFSLCCYLDLWALWRNRFLLKKKIYIYMYIYLLTITSQANRILKLLWILSFHMVKDWCSGRLRNHRNDVILKEKHFLVPQNLKELICWEFPLITSISHITGTFPALFYLSLCLIFSPGLFSPWGQGLCLVHCPEYSRVCVCLCVSC